MSLTISPEKNEHVLVRIDDILDNLGVGVTAGTAYDTAWVARLSKPYPNEPRFRRAVQWLRDNQHKDGSWGAPVVHYHDRFVSTLAAIIALKECGDDIEDKLRIKRGEEAVQYYQAHLPDDDHDTIGFPIISVALALEANALSLNVQLPHIRFEQAYRYKVDALLKAPKRDWRQSPVSFSIEALHQTIKQDDLVQSENGSVGMSPSATAGYLLSHQNDEALQFLLDVLDEEGTGAAPALKPIDVFENAWSILYLVKAGAIEPDSYKIRRSLEELWETWSPADGVSWSSYFRVSDMDDTSACFAVLHQAGYPVDPNVFGFYETDHHFVCYHDETDISISAQVRLLYALRLREDLPQCQAWIAKIVRTLREYDKNGQYWPDKWHSSPYYVNSLAITCLRGLDDELAASRINWILDTQHSDGGWGYFGVSTLEETAYCLLALVELCRDDVAIDEAIIHNAGRFLMGNFDHKANLLPLWIGKSLYTPKKVVRAVIFSALTAYQNWLNESGPAE